MAGQFRVSEVDGSGWVVDWEMSADMFAILRLLRDLTVASWKLFRAASSSDIRRDCLYVDDKGIGMIQSSREVSRKDSFPCSSVFLFSIFFS